MPVYSAEHLVVLGVWHNKSGATSGVFFIAHCQTAMIYTIFGNIRVTPGLQMISQDKYLTQLNQVHVTSFPISSSRIHILHYIDSSSVQIDNTSLHCTWTYYSKSKYNSIFHST
ncbi:unnamed protein product [Meganyctiphanes norvegica]|uniref:Uncharacterized protein n=1 Tax=Meganyctiphanes norvegica TaxID=48144 RepID=A0AAV2RSY2_MEGNR